MQAKGVLLIGLVLVASSFQSTAAVEPKETEFNTAILRACSEQPLEKTLKNGKDHLILKQYKHASMYFGCAKKRYPKSIKTNFLYAKSELLQSNYESAKKAFLDLQSLNSKDPQDQILLVIGQGVLDSIYKTNSSGESAVVKLLAEPFENISENSDVVFLIYLERLLQLRFSDNYKKLEELFKRVKEQYGDNHSSIYVEVLLGFLKAEVLYSKGIITIETYKKAIDFVFEFSKKVPDQALGFLLPVMLLSIETLENEKDYENYVAMFIDKLKVADNSELLYLEKSQNLSNFLSLLIKKKAWKLATQFYLEVYRSFLEQNSQNDIVADYQGVQLLNVLVENKEFRYVPEITNQIKRSVASNDVELQLLFHVIQIRYGILTDKKGLILENQKECKRLLSVAAQEGRPVDSKVSMFCNTDIIEKMSN